VKKPPSSVTASTPCPPTGEITALAVAFEPPPPVIVTFACF